MFILHLLQKPMPARRRSGFRVIDSRRNHAPFCIASIEHPVMGVALQRT